MAERLTKSAARNVFYGGSAFFFIIFVALTVQSFFYISSTSTNVSTLTPSVAHGKAIWERNACINCHTILGEGAYYAPELGNVWDRHGGKDDDAGARAWIKNWIATQPGNTPGRRKMPHFNLSDSEVNDLIDFLKWTSTIKRQDWPPNAQGNDQG
ncbi:MAG: cytochrome c [Alphaproteobacteria bacterium]|nr:cytochrome c [Alphaproteobacteria bacterium]